MKVKKIGKLAVLVAAGAALVTTLINDNKERGKKEETVGENN